MDVEVIRSFLANLATDLGYITVIGTFIYQVGVKPIVKNIEKREEEHREKMREIAKEQNKPINEMIESLKESNKNMMSRIKCS